MCLCPPAAPARSAPPGARTQNPQRPPQPPYLRLRFLHRPSFVFDVVIAGGGPAGLSAALLLGRCRRRVLLCDTGQPRNARSRAMHGYLSRDGIAPMELLSIGRDQLRQYGVDSRQVAVEDVTTQADGFDVRLANGDHVQALTVLIAT